ncbi:MAG TPA: prepilin-type N-terminal cleavage/methylation domain-containing protein [Planctomycetota bacterium]|nr:prepilin-type N-terminal cleavage/methylation domain-containing protein [Planctomycetota bacterium]
MCGCSSWKSRGSPMDRFAICDLRVGIPLSRPRTSNSGFTLIEMLVVIVILGILMSLAIVGVSSAMKSARVTKTEALIENLAGGCETYRTKWGDYPPSTLSEFKVSGLNDINNGMESLTACLASTAKGDPFLTVRDDQLMNADSDSASRNVTKWYFGDFQLREIADGFGYAMCYMHWKDYEKPNPMTRRIKTDSASPEASFEPTRSVETKTFLRPHKFQILSVGPDGKPGTPDDIQAR